MLVTIEPMPSSALMSAAIAVLAPRSIELNAMTGIIDPSASPNSVAGPNAATAIDRRLNSPALHGRSGQRRPLSSTQTICYTATKSPRRRSRDGRAGAGPAR